MTTRKTNLTHALLALGLALAGCSDDGEAAPTPSLPNLDAGLPGVDSSVPQGDAGTSGDAGPSSPGQTCFSGKPSTNTQFLNACATGCRPFADTRLPGYQPGKLPPL